MRTTIREVRAYTVRGKGADYHDQPGAHWIDDHIATPMSVYPEYRDSRRSFGIDVLGTLVVEIEASDGTLGFAVTTAGEIGAWIVKKHLARFLEARDPESWAPHRIARSGKVPATLVASKMDAAEMERVARLLLGDDG